MKAQHTPGPWAFAGSGWRNLKDVCIAGQDDAGISICFASSHDEASMAEYRANARLIAAAPDLLDALRHYGASCDATETTPCGYEGNMCCKVARAAIAKATGEQA